MDAALDDTLEISLEFGARDLDEDANWVTLSLLHT